MQFRRSTMGLDLLPYLENHSCIVAHNTFVLKLKLNYIDDLSSQDRSLLLKSVSRQAAHNQLEEVLRAVLYVLERDQQISSIQTRDFVVHPKTTPWQLANKIEFMVDDKDMRCYQDCLILDIECKQMAGSFATSRKRKQDKTPISKETHNRNKDQESNRTEGPTVIKDASQLGKKTVKGSFQGKRQNSGDLDANSLPQRTKKLKSLSTGASLSNKRTDVANTSQAKHTSSHVLSGHLTGKSHSGRYEPKLHGEHTVTPCSVVLSKRTEDTEPVSLEKGSGEKFESNPDCSLNQKNQEENRQKTANSKMKRLSFVQTSENVLSEPTGKSHSGRYEPKLHGEHAVTPCSVVLSKRTEDTELDSLEKGSGERLERNPDCSLNKKNQEENRQKTGNPKTERLSLVQTSENVLSEPTQEQSSLKSMTMYQGALHNGQVTENDSQVVANAALECIKKFRHQRTQVLLGSDVLSSEQDKHGNIVEKQKMPPKSLTYFEMQDSDMVEVYDNGSIVSPSYTCAVHKRKRKHQDSEYLTASHSANKRAHKKCVSDPDHSKLLSPKRNLYDCHSSFVPFVDINNQQKGYIPCIKKQSKQSVLYCKKYLNKGRRDSHSSDLKKRDDSISTTGNEQCNTNIITQYKNTLDYSQETPTQLAKWKEDGEKRDAVAQNSNKIDSAYNGHTKRTHRLTRSSPKNNISKNSPSSQTKPRSEHGDQHVHVSRASSQSTSDFEFKAAQRKDQLEDKASNPLQGTTKSSDLTLRDSLKGKVFTRNSHQKSYKCNTKTPKRQNRKIDSISTGSSTSSGALVSRVSSCPVVPGARRRMVHHRSCSSSNVTPPVPRHKKRDVNVRRLNIPDSIGRRESLRQAQSRLLAAKDGVWLLDVGHKESTRKKSEIDGISCALNKRGAKHRSSRQQFAKAIPSDTPLRPRMSESSPSLSSRVETSPPDHGVDGCNRRVLRPRPQVSESSPALSTPVRSSPPVFFADSPNVSTQRQRPPSSQPSRFWQVLSYFFSNSKATE